MKKILCILMIVLMLMGICSITASAEVTTEISDEAVNTPTTSTGDEANNWLFFQNFIDTYDASLVFYEELYYHYNTDGNIEWALIKGYVEDIILTWDMKPCAVLEDRVVREDGVLIGPFSSNYGIFDVNKQEFIDLGNASEEEKYYDEIYAYLNENNIGEIIGDMDNDRKLTVKDATYIQKCIAEIISFPERDEVRVKDCYSEGYGYLAYISDFNRDGVRNVKDATAIQKYIAGLEY